MSTGKPVNPWNPFPIPEFKREVQVTKYDSGKPQFDLIPAKALEKVAELLTLNLKKYPDRDNWKKLENNKERFFQSLLRHINKHQQGELYDKESLDPTTLHLTAIITNALFLLEMQVNPDYNKGLE
jgi:hypothetical protein